MAVGGDEVGRGVPVHSISTGIPVAVHLVSEVEQHRASIRMQAVGPGVDVGVEAPGCYRLERKSVVAGGVRRRTPRFPGDERSGAGDANRRVAANIAEHPWLVGREVARPVVTPLGEPVHDARVAVDTSVPVGGLRLLLYPWRVWWCDPHLGSAWRRYAVCL